MGFLNGRHPAWIKTLPICGVLSKQSFYKLFIAGTATEANRDILFINCAPLIARSHQLPIHMDIKPRVLNLLRLISFNSIQQREGEARSGGYAPAFLCLAPEIGSLEPLSSHKKLQHSLVLSRLEICSVGDERTLDPLCFPQIFCKACIILQRGSGGDKKPFNKTQQLQCIITQWQTLEKVQTLRNN